MDAKSIQYPSQFYCSQSTRAARRAFTITLEDADVAPEVRLNNDGLFVRGHIAAEKGSEVERQNSLWGINGPVDKFIIHVLETAYTTVTLHASALVSPSGDKVCLAIGHSGSGKSVLVLSALKAGWKLLASEYVLAGMNGTLHIHTGNYLDNMSVKAIGELRAKLPRAAIMEDNFIKDPLMHKVFVDLSPYQFAAHGIDIPPATLTVVILNIHSAAHKSGASVQDDYFFTRSLQHIATEKIAMPLIMDRQMIDTVSCGSAAARTKVVEAIVAKADKRVILGGDASGFSSWLAGNA